MPEQELLSDAGSTTEENSDEERAAAIRSSVKGPKVWMTLLGVVLAACAGIVNVVAFRTLQSRFVSHVTGTASKVAMRLEGVHFRGDEQFNLYDAALLIMSFIFGSFLCGMLIDKGQVHFGDKSFYGIALIGNSFLILAAFFTADQVCAAYFAACACGLQNAMCTSHFGAVIRTTHLTGAATDIGLTSGRVVAILLRGRSRCTELSAVDCAEIGIDATKLAILLSIVGGFFCGSYAGAYLSTVIGVHAFLLPAGITGVGGIVYTFFRATLKSYFKSLEQSWVKYEIADVESTLHRTQAHMHDAIERQKSQGPRSREGFGDGVENDLEHVVKVLHDVELSLAEMTELQRPRG